MPLPNGVDPNVIRRNFLDLERSLAGTAADLAAHIADPTDAHAASAISYDNAASGLLGATVQAALDNLVAPMVIDEADGLLVADEENGTLLLDEEAFA